MSKSYSKLKSIFTPEEQGTLEAIATMRVENKVLGKNFAQLRAAYDSLYVVMITLLDAQPDKELRIHQSQFLRFKREYRIDQKVEGEEVVLRLLTITDDAPKP